MRKIIILILIILATIFFLNFIDKSKEPIADLIRAAAKKEKIIKDLQEQIQKSSVISVKENEPLHWENFEIPDKASILNTKETEIQELYKNLLTSHDFLQPENTIEKVQLDGQYIVQSITKEGLNIDQMFNVSNDELTAERWSDPKLGKIMRGFYSDSKASSLTIDKIDGTRMDIISLPDDEVEYLTITKKEEIFISFKERGEERDYLVNLEKGRFYEYDNDRKRQFEIINENLFREVDEKGNRLSFFKLDKGILVRAD